MKKLRDFKCTKCDKVFEEFVHDDQRVIQCKCGNEASRMLCDPKCFRNTVGGSPSAR